MRWSLDRAAFGRWAVIGLALVASMLVGVVIGTTFTVSDAEAQTARREFKTGTGLLLNYVKADQTAQFEAVMQKVKEALQKSGNAQRKQQAQGWKVYKAQEPGPNNSVLYVFIMDPAVPGADYAVSAILFEAFPADVQKLHEQFRGVFPDGMGQSIVNMQLVNSFAN